LFVWRPTRRTSGKKGTVMVLRSKVPFMGTRCNTAVSWLVWGRDAPFCGGWTAPLCCEGTSGAGACSALMAEAAEAAGPAEATGCERAVEMPETGSVLVAGHRLFGALVLRAAQACSLPFAGAAPFGGADDDAADTVELVEACDDSDEDELVRWALFRGKLSALHACLSCLFMSKWTGGATAVIWRRRGRGQGPFLEWNLAARWQRVGPRRQRRSAARSCAHTMRNSAGSGKCSGWRAWKPCVVSCAIFVGAPCSVGTAGAADTQVQRQGRGGQGALSRWRPWVQRWMGCRVDSPRIAMRRCSMCWAPCPTAATLLAQMHRRRDIGEE
jgi:hypothetical protein